MHRHGSSKIILFAFLIFIPSALALSSGTSSHSDSSGFSFVTFDKPALLAFSYSNFSSALSFDFVTFTKPVLLNMTLSSFESSIAFDFVTFEQVTKLNISDLLHSSKASFDVGMNYTNRTNISLSIMLPSKMFEGQDYSVLFVLNNSGNQNLTNISFNFFNYTILFDLSAKETAIYTSEFTARNGTLILANISCRINSTASIFRNISTMITAVPPLIIESIDFLPEQFLQGDRIDAVVKIKGFTSLNATIYAEDKYYDFNISENESKEFRFNLTAINGSNFTAIIDAPGILLIGSKQIVTGLLPDLTGQIFGDENGSKLMVNTLISSANFTIRVIERDDFSVLSEKDYFVGAIYRNLSILLWNATSGHTLIAYIDFYNSISEINETNNKAEAYAGKKMFVVLDDYYSSAVRRSISDYIHSNLKGYSFSTDYWHSDIVLSIGRTYAFDNSLTLKSGFGHYDSGIVYYDKFGSLPYNGLVNYYYMDSKKRVFVLGNSLSGTIAALKQLVSGSERVFIGDEDIDAVRVYDYLSLFDSIDYEQVENALYDRMIISQQINTTSSSGIPLRLLHLTPAYSDKLVNYLQTGSTNNQQTTTQQLPVVLAQGLWSNLYSWQDFGIELADSGRDVYLIEITGGPGQDCENCVNYNFDDLTDDYYPALIAKVKSDSGQSKLQYVGFSNGCRTALSSLQKGAVDPASVETFVGVGCPGAFSELSLFARHVNESGDKMIVNFRTANKTHVTFDDVTWKLDYLGKLIYIYGNLPFKPDNVNKISLSLFGNYEQWMQNVSDEQPTINLFFNNFLLIIGNMTQNTDMISSVNDNLIIYNTTKSNNKDKLFLKEIHTDLPDKKVAKNKIRMFINNATR